MSLFLAHKTVLGAVCFLLVPTPFTVTSVEVREARVYNFS